MVYNFLNRNVKKGDSMKCGKVKQQLRRNRILRQCKRGLFLFGLLTIAGIGVIGCCKGWTVTSYAETISVRKEIPLAGLSQSLWEDSLITVENHFLPFQQQATSKEAVPMYLVSDAIVKVLPDDTSKTVGTVNALNKILVYEKKKEWTTIRWNGTIGYVKSFCVLESSPVTKVSSTAYYDKYHRISASGRPLTEGVSLAGKVGWLGKQVSVYRCNKDGSVGEWMGNYRFDDTGYGAPSGEGESRILKGKTMDRSWI